jgi:formate hydrogenlyase subunit 5
LNQTSASETSALKHTRLASPREVAHELVDGQLEQADEGQVVASVHLSALEAGAKTLSQHGARFVSLFVTHTPEISLLAVFAFRGELVCLRSQIDNQPLAYQSISTAIPAALWAERELNDRFDVTPLGHPDLTPLKGPDPDLLRSHVVGEDIFSIPYGPIRSGIFEAVQFAIQTGGEDISGLEVRPFFKHRELEQRFVGLSFEHGGYLAERIAGIASVSHAIAFCGAVEHALQVAPPRRASLWRTLYAELERVANHLDVASHLAEDSALAVGQARFLILKEDVLRLQAQLTGSRFARGIITPGGVRSDAKLSLDDLHGAVDAFEHTLGRDRKLLLGTTSFTDRLFGSGPIDRATVESYGGVGPVARASGVSTDARFERPYAAYGSLGFEVVTREDGDAMARLEVRFGEIYQSLHLIRQVIDDLRRTQGELLASLPTNREGASLGWSETPQGETVWWVEVANGAVELTRIASPSFRNWPLFAQSFRGDVLTDFAFIEHSFGLTPAGADR